VDDFFNNDDEEEEEDKADPDDPDDSASESDADKVGRALSYEEEENSQATPRPTLAEQRATATFSDDYLGLYDEDKIICDTINPSQPKPEVSYHNIFRLALSNTQAVRNKTRFNIECFSRPLADEKSSKNYQPLETPGVDKVLSIDRGDIGYYLWHRTQNKLHYDKTEEEWAAYEEAADRKNIAIISYPPDGEVKVFQDEGQQFILMNGNDPSDLVSGVCLEDIFEDIICGDGNTDIAEPGKRYNRGVSIGISGCQSHEKKKSTVGLAQPVVIKGTSRFPNSFTRMTSCGNDLIERAKVNIKESTKSDDQKEKALARLDGLFNNKDAAYNSHMREWASKCSASATDKQVNMLQSLSWNCYVHDKPEVDPRVRNVLLDHIDSENPLEESHDVLIGVWQKIYSRKFGRFVTLSGTGSLRKSVEYLLSRDLLVKQMAQTLLDKATIYPSHLRWVEKKSFCPVGQSYKIVPIHLHTTVHLSAATGPIVELRDWLWRDKQVVMSYYLAEEMCFAFLDTNNPFRFYTFAQKFIADYKSSGKIPLAEGETFLGNCEAYMTRTYGGWNGTKEPGDGMENGAIRFQCATNFPRTNYVNFKGLRDSERIKRKYANKQVSKSVFEAAHKEIVAAVVGKGDLLAAKLLYLDAMLGMILKPDWLDQCVMGSAKTLERLKKNDDRFKTKNQVGMLYDCIRVIGDEKGKIPRSKAEEVGCKTLKLDESKGHDVIFEDQELHWPEFVGNTIVVKRMSAATDFEVHNLSQGGFEHGSTAHYFPQWADVNLPLLTIAGTTVRISSKSNYEFKPGKLTKKAKETPAVGIDFTFDKCQALIQDSNYIVIRDPLKFVSSTLRVLRQDLHDAILVRETSVGSHRGYLASLDALFASNRKFTEPFKQIRQLSVAQRPPHQTKREYPGKWSYQCVHSATMAMLVHLMFNVHLVNCQHWSSIAMEHKKDLVVLLPVHGQKESCYVAGVLFRVESTIQFRYVRENCKVMSKRIIAYDKTVDSIQDMIK
jgi:hypothetical protein